MIQQIITFAFAAGKLRCGHSLYSSWFACIFHSFKIASYRKPEVKRICVCSQTLGGKKSNNPWHKEYTNGMFLSVYLRRLLKSKTIFKRALNLFENGTFMQKYGRTAPCFAFSGRWRETGLKFSIFLSSIWTIGSLSALWNRVWSTSVPDDCMQSDQSWERNTNHQTVWTAWLRRCSPFGTPPEYRTVGLRSHAQILI